VAKQVTEIALSQGQVAPMISFLLLKSHQWQVVSESCNV